LQLTSPFVSNEENEVLEYGSWDSIHNTLFSS
jgi:hypothetical protein